MIGSGLFVGAWFSDCLLRFFGGADADAQVSHGHGLVDSGLVAAGRIEFVDADVAIRVNPTIYELEPLLVSDSSFVTLLAKSKRYESDSRTFLRGHHGGCELKDPFSMRRSWK